MVSTKNVNAPAGNRVSAPSAMRRYGSQLCIIGVGLAMWLVFIAAAPAVFTDIDIYLAFAQTSPQFGIIALALTFVVITGEIDLSFPSIMALGTAIFAITTSQFGLPWYVGLVGAFATGAVCGLFNGFLVAKLNIPSLVITIGLDEWNRRSVDRRGISGNACYFPGTFIRFPYTELLDAHFRDNCLDTFESHSIWCTCFFSW